MKILARDLFDHIPEGLDSNIHKGFTVGNRGKTMYWYFIWHATTGNASIYTAGVGNELKRSYIKNDQEITIHFR